MAITKGIHHVALKVEEAKFDAVVKFYTDVFGLTVRKQMGEGAAAAAQLDSGNGVCLEVFANGSPELPADGVVAHIGFWVDDPDDAAAKAEAAGCKVTVTPREVTMPTNPPSTIYVAFFRGLAGELVEIFYEK